MFVDDAILQISRSNKEKFKLGIISNEIVKYIGLGLCILDKQYFIYKFKKKLTYFIFYF